MFRFEEMQGPEAEEPVVFHFASKNLHRMFVLR